MLLDLALDLANLLLILLQDFLFLAFLGLQVLLSCLFLLSKGLVLTDVLLQISFIVIQFLLGLNE